MERPGTGMPPDAWRRALVTPQWCRPGAAGLVPVEPDGGIEATYERWASQGHRVRADVPRGTRAVAARRHRRRGLALPRRRGRARTEQAAKRFGLHPALLDAALQALP